MSTAHAHVALPATLHAVEMPLQRLWDGATSMDLRRLDYLYLPGDAVRSVFLVRSGYLRIGRLLESGGEVTLDVVGPGDFVGEAAGLGELHRNDTAQALQAVRVAPLPHPIFEAAVRRNAEHAHALARTVLARQRRLELRLAWGASEDCRRRLALVLAEMADRFGRTRGDAVWIEPRLTHEELARFIGAARETVTPILVAMREQGSIDYDRRSFRILDRAALLGSRTS